MNPVLNGRNPQVSSKQRVKNQGAEPAGAAGVLPRARATHSVKGELMGH